MQRSFEVKLGKKGQGSFTVSRERTADTLISDLEFVSLVIEGRDLQENFVPTANCIRDIKERQLVTRTGSSKNTLLCMPSAIMNGR